MFATVLYALLSMSFMKMKVLKKSTNKLYTEDVYSVTRPSVGSVKLKVGNLKLATRTNIELQKKTIPLSDHLHIFGHLQA